MKKAVSHVHELGSSIKKIKIQPIRVLSVAVAILLAVVVVQWDRNESLADELAVAKSSVKLYDSTSTGGTAQNLQQQQTTAKSAPEKLIPVSDADHIVGSKDADVILVEYSDFECPFCKTFHSNVKQIVQEYGGKVAWVYRHYPLGIHQNAQKEAEASECAADQGGNAAFWSFGNTVFDRTTSNGLGFSLDKLAPLAKEQGLDAAAFQQCLDSGKYAAKVRSDQAGGDTVGIQGTPTTVVVSKKKAAKFIPGALPYNEIKQAVTDAL